MPGVFAGKFAFRSTSTSGATCYLTSLVNSGDATVYPAMSAPVLADPEKLILYVQSDGSYILALAVFAKFSGKVSLAYLKGQPELGFVTTDPLPANAQAFSITTLAIAPATWSILDAGTKKGTPLAYILGSQMPLLTYAPPPAQPSTLSAELVTPGYSALAQGKQGQKADLRHCDLSGLDLSGVDFTGADFTGANLAGTKLGGATLDGATLSGLDLSGVAWGNGVSAIGTHFEESLLVGAHIGSAGKQAKFSGAFFNASDLGGAHFAGADLTSATFYGANLTGVTLDGADLSNAYLGGSATATPATLAYAQMSNVTLTGANLFGVNLTFATLYGAATKVNSAATIEQADFSNAYLEGVSFQGSNLQGARFDGACLVGAAFTGASLGASAANSMPASFVGACLPGATFTGAAISGVNFANAALSFANGSFPVRFCTAVGPMPPPPDMEPINCTATVGLDLTTLQLNTICPNGSTLAANQARKLALVDMLTAAGAPTQWVASSCLTAAGQT